MCEIILDGLRTIGILISLPVVIPLSIIGTPLYLFKKAYIKKLMEERRKAKETK
jgi:hypothetical protein